METKCIDIGFLHEAVQKVEKKGEISKDLFFETSLVQKEGEVSFWQSVKRFFGYQPQGWKLNPDIISQHIRLIFRLWLYRFVLQGRLCIVFSTIGKVQDTM
jgi:hypothetical protein